MQNSRRTHTWACILLSLCFLASGLSDFAEGHAVSTAGPSAYSNVTGSSPAGWDFGLDIKVKNEGDNYNLEFDATIHRTSAACSGGTDGYYLSYDRRPMDANGAPLADWTIGVTTFGVDHSGTTCSGGVYTNHKNSLNWGMLAPHGAMRVVRMPGSVVIAEFATIRPNWAAEPAPALTATAAGVDKIDLSWSTSQSPGGGFELERRTTGGTYELIASPASAVRTHQDTGLLNNTTYDYRIRAKGSNGVYGQYSNTATAKTFQGANCAPGQGFENLKASQIGGTFKVYFKWKGENIGGWDVYLPNPGDPPYPAKSGHIEPSQVDGHNGVYGTSFGTQNTYTSFRIVHVGSTGAGCYATGSPSTTEEASPAATGGGVKDPENTDEEGNGADCGMNMFCWIKAALSWAFKAGPEVATEWGKFVVLVENKPPFSLISAIHDWVNTGLSDIWSTGSGDGNSQNPQEKTSSHTEGWGCPRNSSRVGVLEEFRNEVAGNCVSRWYHDAVDAYEDTFSWVKKLLTFAIWGVGVFSAFQLITGFILKNPSAIGRTSEEPLGGADK